MKDLSKSKFTRRNFIRGASASLAATFFPPIPGFFEGVRAAEADDHCEKGTRPRKLGRLFGGMGGS
jgi:hypothetical protein